MRLTVLQTALCLTLAAALTSSADAGVRGKPTQLKKPAPTAATANRVAQSDPGYTASDTQVVPLPADTTETIIDSTVTADPTCACAKPAATVRTNYVAVPMMMPMMAAPMMVAPMMPAPMYAAPGCPGCGVMANGGMSPAVAAGYQQAFGPGLYRTGAEMGMNHYPYYSYRRPWYFPGQPSFHRSTDYVW